MIRRQEQHAHNFRYTRGFSIIEMLVYVLILAVISVFLVYAIISMIRSVVEISVSRSILGGAMLSLERITREAKDAYDINEATSTLAAHPGRILFLTETESGATTSILFFISGDALMMKRGTSTAQSLLPERVAVENLVFRLATSTLSKSVKIELELSGARGSVTRTEQFYGSAQLRNY